MPNSYYVPKMTQAPVGGGAPSPSDVVKETTATTGAISQEQAAQAFQEHLNKGYQGMLETINELPPEVRVNVPSPEAYSDSEDKRVAWYSMANSAIAKANKINDANKPGMTGDDFNKLNSDIANAPLNKEDAAKVQGVADQNNTTRMNKLVGGVMANGQPNSDLSSINSATTGEYMTPQEVAGNKKRIQNSDGTFSTERSITVDFDTPDGKIWVNLPTIVNGVQLSQKDAIDTARKNGIKNYPTFKTESEALSEAQKRSNQIGAAAGDATNPVFSPKSQIGRKFKIASGRMPAFDSFIQKASADTGVSPEIIKAFMAWESSAKNIPSSVEGSTAYGPMQLLKSTADSLGVKDYKDPAQNIAGGAKLIAQLLKKYGGDLEKVAAAYHDGEGAVDSAISLDPNNWKQIVIDKSPRPEEADGYPKAVMQLYQGFGGAPMAMQKEQQAAPQQPTISEFQNSVVSANGGDAGILNLAAENRREGALSKDRAAATAEAKASTAGDLATARLKVAQDRLKSNLNAKDFEKKDKYTTAIKDLAPKAYGLIQIDRLVGGLDNEGDIPGVGLMDNSVKRWLETAATPEAQAIRQAINSMYPDEAHSKFGSAFTKNEQALMDASFGLGWRNDVQAFRLAMRTLRDKTWQSMNNKWATLPPDVKQELKDQGVSNPDMFGDFHSDVIESKKPPEAVTLPKFNNVDEYNAAKKAGTIKPGDFYIRPNGQKGRVQ